MNHPAPEFLAQTAIDEVVIKTAEARMADINHLVAAAYRKTTCPRFMTMLGELALAKRNRLNQEANRLCCELMWELEDEVLAQARREVVLK